MDCTDKDRAEKTGVEALSKKTVLLIGTTTLPLKPPSLVTTSDANRGLENSNNRGYYGRIYGK